MKRFTLKVLLLSLAVASVDFMIPARSSGFYCDGGDSGDFCALCVQRGGNCDAHYCICQGGRNN
jgi:hypothetical protein